MTTSVHLADPTDYGNKPGDGPLRPGGQARQDPQIRAADLPSQRSAASEVQMPALYLVRDLRAGPERVRQKRTLYLPKAPGEKEQHYNTRLARSVYHNFFGRTVDGLTGLVFRKDVQMGDDVPLPIVEQWENIDNAGTHGDVFCRDVFEDSLTAGHCAIFVEYPNTGGEVLTLAAESALRPYWVHILKENILSWRTTVESGKTLLTQVVLFERQMVPQGSFGEREQVRYRVLRRDENGVVSYELLEITPNRTIERIESGPYPTQTEIPLAEVSTSGRYGLFESRPPLLDLAYLNVAHYQQWSDYATSIHMTCVPILFGAGVPDTDSQGQPVTVGPNAGIYSPDPNAKLSYTSHDGAALGATKQALDDLKSDMGTLGLSMLAPQKRSAETAEAKRLDKSTSDSALAVAARGLQDGIEQALIYHARYLRLEDGGSVTINRDFEGLLMEAPVMQAYAQLVKVGFPPRLILEMLQQGGRIPEDADLDEVELEMTAQMIADEEAEREEREARLAMANAENDDDEVAVVGNPYKVVKRGNKWAVVKADTGELVKEHDSREKAIAHFRALEANVTD